MILLTIDDSSMIRRVIGGRRRAEEQSGGIQAGAVDCLAKPFTREDLTTKVLESPGVGWVR